MKLIIVMAYLAMCAYCSESPASNAPTAQSTPEFLGPAYSIALKIADALAEQSQGKNGQGLNDA